jgi:hypothetical protein
MKAANQAPALAVRRFGIDAFALLIDGPGAAKQITQLGREARIELGKIICKLIAFFSDCFVVFLPSRCPFQPLDLGKSLPQVRQERAQTPNS